MAHVGLWHAGDSACSIPPQTIPQECLNTIREWTPRLAKALDTVGLINIQYVVQDNKVYCTSLSCDLCWPCQQLSQYGSTHQSHEGLQSVSVLPHSSVGCTCLTLAEVTISVQPDDDTASLLSYGRNWL